MINKTWLIVASLVLILFNACKPSIVPDKLYGKWDYTKVENPNMNPPDSIAKSEIRENKPFIQFSRDQSLIIHWGDKVLSHGTFTIDGDNIIYREQLTGGKVRQFPFWVSKITSKEIVFETLGEEGSRVTAIKE